GSSRELCGGTHVRSTAEIGAFRVLSETSSAANVRRIEAVTGPVAVRLLREHDRLLEEVAAALPPHPEDAPQPIRAPQRERKALEKARRSDAAAAGAIDIEQLLQGVAEVDGVPVLAAAVQAPDAGALLQAVDRLKGRLPDGAIVLGTAVDGRAHLIVSVAPALVGRGLKAGSVVKAAAAVVGGGGGGRDTLAQAGGRRPEKLQDAVDAAAEGSVSAH